MNCLKSLLSEDGAVRPKARAKLEAKTRATGGTVVGTRDIAGARVEVSLSLVKTSPRVAPASSSLLVRGGFQRGLRQAESLAIALAG